MTRPDGPFGEFLDEFLAGPLNKHNGIQATEPRTQFENNSQLDSDLRNVRVGDQNVTFSNGRFTVQTTASGTSTDGVETANIAEYSPGLELSVGLFIRKDTDPVGVAEWGYGGDAFSNEAFWRLDSDGDYTFVRTKGDTETLIPQSLWTPDTNGVVVSDADENDVGKVWGFDPLDGTGPSGYSVSTPVTTLFGVDMVLYGGGGIAPWTVGPDRRGRIRKIYPFVFSPDGEELLDQFNQPVFARLDNDGTATADELIITERQALTYGVNQPPERGTQHVKTATETIGSPTAFVGLRRADAGGPTRIDILDFDVRVNERAHVWFLVDPDVTNSPTWEQPARDTVPNRAPATETAIEASDDIAVDASTGVALEGGIAGGATNQSDTVSTTSFGTSPFIRDRPVVMMLEPLTNQDVLDEEVVINVREGV